MTCSDDELNKDGVVNMFSNGLRESSEFQSMLGRLDG